MDRRDFLIKTTFTTVALTTFGKPYLYGNKYIGDCETTSDLLGPFYRPNSPVRNNLVVPEKNHPKIVLKGVVRHDDCVTPYIGAKIELWHCSPEGIYDNDTDAFLYRGTTYCNESGQYEFTTQMPVPYLDGPVNYRPAHFHLLVSAEGYQSLITQIYFKGDPHIKEDLASANGKASLRILEARLVNGVNEVQFDIVLSKKYVVSAKDLNNLIGEYISTDGKKTIQFFNRNGELWFKNKPFGQGFDYKGKNHFAIYGWPENTWWTFDFKLEKNGKITAVERYKWDEVKEITKVYYKTKSKQE